jgi:ABC-2 type transport system permease protein
MSADTRPSAPSAAPARPDDGGHRGTARRFAVLGGVLRGQRRSLIGWAIALTAVCGIYIGFYPLIGEEQMVDMAGMMPEDLAAALGYDRLGDATGYLTATIFGLLAPALLFVFAIGAGARLLAGNEEDGTLELELTHPVARSTVYLERLLGLWSSTAVLVVVTALVSWALVVALDLDVASSGILAGSLGLLLLTAAMGTVAFAVGAATGRRVYGLASAAGLAVAAYMADAIGPLVGADWVTEVSPWSWYLANDPLANGVDVLGYALLGLLALVAAALGRAGLEGRDLGV